MPNGEFAKTAGSGVEHVLYSRLASHRPVMPLTVPQWRSKHEASDAAAIASALRRQLGPRWGGFRLLGGAEKAVATVAALRVLNLDWRAAAAHCNRAALDGLPVDALVPPLDGRDRDAVENAVEDAALGHFHSRTVLVEILVRAKEAGHLPSASFLWTQKFDRQLWLTIHSVGRRSLLPETAAIVSHWKDERMMGRPLETLHADVLVDGVLGHGGGPDGNPSVA